MKDLPPDEPFFFRPEMGTDPQIVMTGDDAHHVSVQRLRRGDRISLFDGAGAIARCVIRDIGRSQVRVEVQARRHEPVPPLRLNLYCAVPKGDRVAVLLDMATQFGMTQFTPVQWERSVVEPGPRATERWRRICLEACKQSRRAYLPAITAPMSPISALAAAEGAGDRVLVAHPGDDSLPLVQVGRAHAASFALFIGPEGGLTKPETEMLRQRNPCFVELGRRILRIEAAAAMLLCAVQILVASPNENCSQTGTQAR